MAWRWTGDKPLFEPMMTQFRLTVHELVSINSNTLPWSISMAWCKTAVTPLLSQWSYCTKPLIDIDNDHEIWHERTNWGYLKCSIIPVSKIWTHCHAQDLWKLSRPCKQMHFYYACQTREIYYVLPYSVDFKAPQELWNPLSKTVHSKCSFIWNQGPVNILNDHKAPK